MNKESKNDNRNIIGYVQLLNGLKEVTTLDNFFLTYTFEQECWSARRMSAEDLVLVKLVAESPSPK